MRWSVVVVVMLGCSDSEPPTSPEEACIVPQPLCGSVDAPTCGNGHVDLCYRRPQVSACYFTTETEDCDGNARSCVDLRFYGGTSRCTANCSATDTTTCDACPPGSSTCETLPLFAFEGAAVSGTRFALASAAQVQLFDGLTPVTTIAMTMAGPITGVPGGWLAIDSGALRTVDPSGAGPRMPLPDENGSALLYGAGGRVLVAWQSATFVRYAITDATGAVLVNARDAVAASFPAKFGIATNATSFFVGARGQLARILPDGSTSVQTGFAAGAATVLWGTTVGWYIGGTTAQRFDGDGVKIGAPFEIAGAIQVVADGDELLVLERENERFVVTRLDAAGTVIATSEEVAAGTGARTSFLARVGADVYVAWTRDGHLQIARAAI